MALRGAHLVKYIAHELNKVVRHPVPQRVHRAVGRLQLQVLLLVNRAQRRPAAGRAAAGGQRPLSACGGDACCGATSCWISARYLPLVRVRRVRLRAGGIRARSSVKARALLRGQRAQVSEWLATCSNVKRVTTHRGCDTQCARRLRQQGGSRRGGRQRSRGSAAGRMECAPVEQVRATQRRIEARRQRKAREARGAATHADGRGGLSRTPAAGPTGCGAGGAKIK